MVPEQKRVELPNKLRAVAINGVARHPGASRSAVR